MKGFVEGVQAIKRCSFSFRETVCLETLTPKLSLILFAMSAAVVNLSFLA